jgi:deoxyribodipyrimidine photolyase-related protein
MKNIALIFPHQLFAKHPAIKASDAIYIIEEHLFFKQFKFHKAKLAFHRASMKYYADTLAKKHDITYIQSIEKESDIRHLIPALAKKGVEEIHFMNPTDFWLEKRIHETSKKAKIKTVAYENKMFINNQTDLKTFFKEGKKSFFQTSFYKQQRLKHQILLEGEDQPLGGKWSFDGDNRKKFPKSATVPQHFIPKSDKYWKESLDYIEKNFAKNPGVLSAESLYPYKPAEAIKSLQHFFEHRFHLFGDYEDAIVKEVSILHHSVLTPMLNIGLLEPMQVVKAAIEFAGEHDVPLNSLEGFVRQIMGWREFIRGMYEAKGVYSRTKNYWGFKRKIPASFYDGTTGIQPIDDTIKKVLETGYCHHIERLMVLGNFMLLCEFDPKEVYRWFMELFIDAYDWVMVPNVYGMSQFADGGTFATKPYISGSNYIFKMSNYKKDDWHKIWDGLFWRFMDVHRDFFLSNPRLGMLVRMYDKMSDEKKEAHHKFGNEFLDRLDK